MIGFLMSGVLRRMTGVDHATAFLASMPGGPVEMANLARQYGGDPGPVVFAQTLRISAIVILVPAALYYLLHETRGSVPEAEFVPDFLGKIGRAACRERVCHTCRSRWLPYP